MLGSSELAAFVATTDLGRARAFYGGGGGVRFERFAGMEQDELACGPRRVGPGGVVSRPRRQRAVAHPGRRARGRGVIQRRGILMARSAMMFFCTSVVPAPIEV